jgi:5-formyltetrahydrofolate cyclo-ligase
LKKRNTLSVGEIRKRSALIQQRILNLPLFKSAKVVGAYYPVGSEVKTLDILMKVLEERKILALPAILEDKIFFYKIPNIEYLKGDQMIISKFGIKEPSSSPEDLIDDIDLLIIPGIAFDRNGCRIGYGRGFYDRYLQRKKYVFSVGLGFELQLLDENLPYEKFDQRVNAVATEEKIVLC